MENQLIVRRDPFERVATLSRVYLDGRFLCAGLEPAPHGAHPCIPAGRYPLALRQEGRFHADYSGRFSGIHKGMIWVREVPGRSWILWHVGNYAENTLGCLLLGQPAPVPGPPRVLSSTATYKRVYPLIASAIEAGNLTHVIYEDALVAGGDACEVVV